MKKINYTLPRIVTITFSPCIDKSTSVSRLVPEKKLKCSYPRLEPGGGGINVARAIKKLGAEALAIYPAGGYTGKYFTSLMNRENIPSIIIETAGETRENIIVFDESSNEQYRFGMPGNPLHEDEWKKILQAIDDVDDPAYIIASGSLPPGVPDDTFARIATLAKKKNARLVADTSGDALKHAAEEGVFLLKPNLGELSFLAGKDRLQETEIADTARLLIDKGTCEAIVVSLGKEGALLVTKKLERMIKAPYAIRKSTVGAGDSMVAGIVFALCSGESLDRAVQFGVACGTAATMNPGTELCRKEDADELVKVIRSEEH